MTPVQFLPIIERAAPLLPQYDSPEARCELHAIAGQESRWAARKQYPIAYARGFWQTEKNGQLLAVLTHDYTRATIDAVLEALCIPKGLDDVFEAVAWCDDLAYCVARLALVLDPAPLPAIGERDAAWTCYVGNWRPGAPRPETWAECYDAAAGLFTTIPTPPAP